MIVERAAPLVQTIIIDPEREYATLREKLDIAVIGENGEIAVDLRTAGKLARKLMETQISAVIDLFSLSDLEEKREYLATFIESLMTVPVALRHPVLLIVDEAHKFSPEGVKARSTSALINVMDSGRKRGIGTFALTQRISKVAKDVIAEAKNVFIGSTTLDLDQDRAGDMLGIRKAERVHLRDLDPGLFYAFGPALGKGIAFFKSDQVETRHPKMGERNLVQVPKASDHIREIVAQIGDLPSQVQEEHDTLVVAQQEIARLKKEIAARPQIQLAPRVETKIEQVQVPALSPDTAATLQQHADAMGELARKLESTSLDIRKQVTLALQISNAVGVAMTKQVRFNAVPVRTPFPRNDAKPITPGLGVGGKRMLIAVAQYPNGATREQLTVLTGYKRSSRDTYIQRLAQRGFVTADRDRVMATADGIAALGADFEPLPTGAALIEYWMARLTGGEKAIFEIVVREYPSEVERAALDDMINYKRSSRDTYIQRLMARQLVTAQRNAIRASTTLFEE